MKKIAILLITLTAFFFTGCEDTWDKHFENQEQGEGNRSSDNLFDYLKSKTEYSKFFELVNSTIAGKELAKDQVLTCWAVGNENMPDISGMDSLAKENLVKNHINNMALYTPKLSDGKIIKMLSGKNLILHIDENNGYILDSIVLQNMNQ